MAKRVCIFSRVGAGTESVNVSGTIFSYHQCKELNRHCFIDVTFLPNIQNEDSSIEYQIKILSDILSKTEYESAHTGYYSSKHNSIEPQIEGYDFIDLDGLQLPNNHLEKIDFALMNIYHIFGESSVSFSQPHEFMALYAINDDEVDAMIASLVDFGYLSFVKSLGAYVISKEGWKHIYEMEKNKTDRSGFVAIAFEERTEKIICALKEGIRTAGFIPTVIRDVEHNNQIVPEIRKYIERCSFLIMDCTIPNLGAYYEAGIASGMGKEVIICCRKDVFDSSDSRPHFDVAQQSMIIWKDETDLVERLVKMIDATVKPIISNY